MSISCVETFDDELPPERRRTPIGTIGDSGDGSNTGGDGNDTGGGKSSSSGAKSGPSGFGEGGGTSSFSGKPKKFVERKALEMTTTSAEEIKNTSPAEFALLTPEQIRGFVDEKQIKAILPAQISNLNEQQIAAIGLNLRFFSKEQWQSINPNVVSQLPANLFSSAIEIKHLNEVQLGRLTSEQLKNIDKLRWLSLQPSQVAAINPNVLANIDPEYFSREIPVKIFELMTKAQVQKITGAQLENLIAASNILPDRVGPKLVKIITKLSAEQIQSVDFSNASILSETWARKTEEQIRALSLEELNNLVEPQLKSLSRSAGKGFRVEQIKNLTPRQIGYFSPEGLRDFNSEQIAALSNEQIASLPERISGFGPVYNIFIPQLPPERVASLSKEFIKNLSQLELQSFTIEQIRMITSEQLAAIRLLKNLSKAQLNALSAEQVKDVSFPNLSRMTKEAIGHFSEEAKRVLYGKYSGRNWQDPEKKEALKPKN